MQSELSIRSAGPDDASLLAELGARTFAETFAVENTAEDMAAYLAASFGPEIQAKELAESDSVFLIAEIDQNAVGYAKLNQGPSPAGVSTEQPIELVRLYVTQDCLGKGVGARLMQACLDEARRLGARVLWLGVWEHNFRAREFYRRWNFREVGTHVFQLGNDAQRDILMERDLECGDLSPLSSGAA